MMTSTFTSSITGKLAGSVTLIPVTRTILLRLHYEKDGEGKRLGIWYPNQTGGDGYYQEDLSNDESQKKIPEQVRDGNRPIPPSLLDSLADFPNWSRNKMVGLLE